MPTRLRSAALLLIALPALCACGPRRAGPAVADPDAVNALLRAELSRVLAGRGLTLDAQGKVVGGTPASLPPPKLYFTPSRTENAATGFSDLIWLHYQQGDYDRNGEVNIADLTPLGLHYGKTSAGPNWQVAQTADGDGNGEINIADVTPIGMSYGVAVGGYVVEAHETIGPWREYGYAPFAAGIDNGVSRVFGYSARSGLIEADFRVRAVGTSPREFDWTVYMFATGNVQYGSPWLAMVAGVPALCYVESDNADLYYAYALNAHPQSKAEWVSMLIDNGAINPWARPVLAEIGGFAGIAYEILTASRSIVYIRALGTATPGASDWQAYPVIDTAAAGGGLGLRRRQGAPTIFYTDSGLNLLIASNPFPTAPGEWQHVVAGAGPAGDFGHPVCAVSGPWTFAAGLSSANPPNLQFCRSTSAAPTSAGDFDQYILNPVGDANSNSCMELVDGLPCLVFSDYGTNALRFLAPSGWDDASAASWFIHDIAGGLPDYFYPSLGLLDGRPAVCWASDELSFAWSATGLPDAAGDWRVSQVDAPVMAYTGGYTSWMSSEGLPVIAFGQTGPDGKGDLLIAVAREK